MFAILLAAGLAVHHAGPTSLDGRVSLLEAKQMLESQELWGLRAELPPEAIKALTDVQLHLQHDQEQEDHVRELTMTVQKLEQRLAALELTLSERPALDSSTAIPVAPMQMQPLVVPGRKVSRPTAKKARKQVPAHTRMAAGHPSESELTAAR